MNSDNKYLDDLAYFLGTPGGLEKRKQLIRGPYNIHRYMKQFEETRAALRKEPLYLMKKDTAESFVDKLPIVHNTSLESLVSIFNYGYILPHSQIDEANVNFNWRIAANQNVEYTVDYVYASPGNGDWLYGLYEIHLKREVENIMGSCFIPSADIKFSDECIREHIMDLSQWRMYLTEYMTAYMEVPEDFMKLPLEKKPELLISGKIPVDMIEKIVCASKKAFKKMYHIMAGELGYRVAMLDKIDITYQGKGGKQDE